MDFELSDEQEAFRKVVRDFAESEIAPHVETWDRTHEFPVDTVLAMGDLGLFGLIFPPEYGGSGADFTTFCLALEELGRVDQSMAITVEAGVGLGANPIFQFGTEDQRQEWLPDLSRGTAHRRVRPHRARCRQRRRRHAHVGDARRRDPRVGHRRREAVHHQLGHVDHVDASR